MAPTGNQGDGIPVEEKGGPDDDDINMISSVPCRENRWGPYHYYGSFWLPDFWLQGTFAARRHLVTRPDDIFVASCPKSGTTWLKALVFSVAHRRRHGPGHPCHPLRTASPHDCVPFLEEVFTIDPEPNLDALPSPRIWSVHTPYSALPASVRDHACRIAYVARDPKDVFVSLFHMRKELSAGAAARPALAMGEAFELFCSGVSPFGPIWEHALEYWNESLRRPGKILFLGYEEMKGDPVGTLRRVADFLGDPFSEEELRGGGVADEIAELCSFRCLATLAVNAEGDLETFKSLPLPRKAFFRRGEVGDWVNHLSPEMAQRLDAITEEKLRGAAGLKLSWPS